jgi:beta-mannosidase
VLDAHGDPKSAWHALARAWAPRTVRLTDDGLDGVSLHVVNEAPATLRASVEIELIHGGRPAASSSTVIDVPAHSARSVQGDALLGYFTDCNNAYRFGPAKYEVIVARLREADSGALLSEDFLFPRGMSLPMEREAAIQAHAERHDDGRVTLEVQASVFLQDVRLSARGFTPSDNHFHLSPSCQRRIAFFPTGAAPRNFEAGIDALNLATPLTVREAREETRESRATE